MRIFLDTADVEAIRKANDTGLLDGVTTNPTKIAATGRRFHELIREICSIVSGPVSAEAVADTAEEIVRQAQELAGLAPNVVNKVPMTPQGLKAAAILEKQKNLRVNVTMVFSPDQACLAMKTGATFVSLVLQRLFARSATVNRPIAKQQWWKWVSNSSESDDEILGGCPS